MTESKPTAPVMTEFNSNLATLQRIDIMLRRATVAMDSHDYGSWFNALRSLKNEVIVKMNENQTAECLDMFRRLENKMKMFFKNSQTNNSAWFVNIDNYLDSFETYIRREMDKRGMLLTNVDSAKLALQRG